MALNKKDIKNIIEKNKDLKERMSKESWKVSYNKKADILILGGKFPKNSGNVYIDEKTGSMIRVGEDSKIYGFVFENYKSIFLKKDKYSFIFWLMFLPNTTFFGMFILLPLYVCLYVCLFVYYLLVKRIRSFDEFKDYKYKMVIENKLSSC